jgi:cell wall-associated NlpC family hydrolase
MLIARCSSFNPASPFQSRARCTTPLNSSDASDNYRSTTGGPAALAAVAFARAQLGKPYIWGGNGNPGFDCSGLTKAAYAAAGITLSRVDQDQYNAGPLLPAGQPLQPGDLVFFGNSFTRSPTSEWSSRLPR